MLQSLLQWPLCNGRPYGRWSGGSGGEPNVGRCETSDCQQQISMSVLRYGPRRMEARTTERPTPTRARAPTARPSSGTPPVSGSGRPEVVSGMTPLGLSTGPGLGPPDPPGGGLLVGVGLGVGVGLAVGGGVVVSELKQVQELLGHANIAETMHTYSHVF
jgi:hypothetical protein